jgi:hypothetical protein
VYFYDSITHWGFKIIFYENLRCYIWKNRKNKKKPQKSRVLRISRTLEKSLKVL